MIARMLLAAAAVAGSTAAATAQTPCDGFADGVAPRNDSMEAALEAVKKLRPGPTAACNEARKLAGLAAALDKQINDGKALCASLDPQSFTILKLNQRIAVSRFNATLIDSEVQRLCR